MAAAASTLATISMQKSLLTTNLTTNITNLLANMTKSSIVYSLLIKSDPGFIQTIADVLDDLMEFTAESTSVIYNSALKQDSKQAASRLLQTMPLLAPATSPDLTRSQSLLRRLILAKNDLLDRICHTRLLDGQEFKLQTANLELIATKILTSGNDTKDRQFMFSKDQTSVVIPIDEVVESSINLNEPAKSVCLQVSFMKINLLAGYAFPGQSNENNVFVETGSIDNLGNHILGEGGISDLNLNPFAVKFAFDFETATDF